RARCRAAARWLLATFWPFAAAWPGRRCRSWRRTPPRSDRRNERGPRESASRRRRQRRDCGLPEAPREALVRPAPAPASAPTVGPARAEPIAGAAQESVRGRAPKALA